MSDLPILSAAARRTLGTDSAVEIFTYDTLDSTNSEAKRQAQTGGADTPALYIARTQTGGRGRLGRSFHSPADTGLYMTLAYTTARPLSESVRVTALAAVAAVAAIEALTDKHPRIKWVNDIYLADAKAAGILTEAVTRPDGRTRMVVGLGINLTTSAFPSGLRAPATSLFSDGEMSAVSPEFTGMLAGRIAASLLGWATEKATAETLPDGERCLDFYRRHLLYVGERVICTRGHEAFEGRVLGVDEDYALLTEADGHRVTLSSGEISVRACEH